MVIDYDILCRELDISYDALTRGNDSYTREHIRLYKKYGKKLNARKNIAILMGLPSDEQVALIRRRKLYKSCPEYFTWDGPTEKAEEELTPLLEK